MKLLVCGGREFSDFKRLTARMNLIHAMEEVRCVIHGGARGADTLAGQWARDHGVQEVVCAANWDYHGKKAGPIRNKAMLLLAPDCAMVLPGGVGTKNMLTLLQAYGRATIFDYTDGVPDVEII